MKWMILLAGVMANASASVLIKLAMTPPRRFPSLDAPWSLFTNFPFLAGLALYGVAFLLYAAALARLPLNVAHPILTAGAVATVSLMSLIIFRESFHWTTLAGIVCVVVGVALITSQAP
jgi:small multidrug resistance pump